MKSVNLEIIRINGDVISTSVSVPLCAHFSANRTGADDDWDHIYITSKDGYDCTCNRYQYSGGNLTYINNSYFNKGSSNVFDNIDKKNRWYHWDSVTGKYVECEEEYQSNAMHNQN